MADEGYHLNKFIYIFSTGIGASTTSTGSGIFVQTDDGETHFVTNCDSFHGAPGERFGVYMLSKKSNFWFALSNDNIHRSANLVSVRIPPRDQLSVRGRRTAHSGPVFVRYDGNYGVCTVGDSLKIVTYLSVLKAEVPIVLHGCFSGLLADGRILVQAPKHPEKFGLIFTQTGSIMGLTQPIGIADFQCGILWTEVENHFGVDPVVPLSSIHLAVIDSDVSLEELTLETVLDSLKPATESVRHVLREAEAPPPPPIINRHFDEETHRRFVEFLEWCIHPTNEIPENIAKEMFGTTSFLEDVSGKRFSDCSENTLEHALILLQSVEQTARKVSPRFHYIIAMSPWERKTKNIIVTFSRMKGRTMEPITFIVVETDILDPLNLEVVTMTQCINTIVDFIKK